ncbi:histidinol-phosphate transaminase, partial [Bacillus pseudomycoides]|nr:histidinol-phosphate transaminase [Bacillus pseudomycoides]
YKPGKSAQQKNEKYGEHAFGKLASKEKQIGRTQRVIEELQKAWHEHAGYLDGGAVELPQTIAKKLQVQKEQC